MNINEWLYVQGDSPEARQRYARKMRIEAWIKLVVAAVFLVGLLLLMAGLGGAMHG